MPATHPHGKSRPGSRAASTFNDNPGLNVSNSVTTLLSAGGSVEIYSNVGSCYVILDITG